MKTKLCLMKFYALIAAALLALAAFSYAQAGDDMKKAADDTGNATKTAATKTAHATKTAAVKTGDATKTAAKSAQFPCRTWSARSNEMKRLA